MTRISTTESAPAPATATRPARRGLGVAVAGCVISGATALLAVGRVWLHYTVPRNGLADLRATATGHGVAQPAATLALVVLAGVVVFPATRGLGRRVAGAAIALAGVGIVYLAVAAIAFTTDQLDLPDSSTYTGGRVTAWPWIALVAGVMAIATGVFAAIASGPWPSMGRRYESGRPSAAKDGPLTELAIWDRLDEGDDPTA
ncbi:MAG TPA: Trp biosynthesis-associated membrane protein [Acidothermaceae bacterium]|nr:Trp biosynthesis-associated membrane protein [Acidothermaceae bacterium]